MKSLWGIFFDAGTLAMVVHAAQHIGEDTGRVRFTAAVFAIGFFLGMIAKCVVGGSYIALALYALGFVLCIRRSFSLCRKRSTPMKCR